MPASREGEEDQFQFHWLAASWRGADPCDDGQRLTNSRRHDLCKSGAIRRNDVIYQTKGFPFGGSVKEKFHVKQTSIRGRLARGPSDAEGGRGTSDPSRKGREVVRSSIHFDLLLHGSGPLLQAESRRNRPVTRKARSFARCSSLIAARTSPWHTPIT